MKSTVVNYSLSKVLAGDGSINSHNLFETFQAGIDELIILIDQKSLCELCIVLFLEKSCFLAVQKWKDIPG